jgi:hypothetical protein
VLGLVVMFLLILIYSNNSFYVICVENCSCGVYVAYVAYVNETEIQQD